MRRAALQAMVLSGGGDGIIFNDTFTDTNNVTWANHVPEKGVWTVTAAATPAKITTNKLVGATAFGADRGIFNAGISDNIYAAIDGFPGGSGQLMFVFRYVDVSNFWRMGLDGANFFVSNPARGTINTQATGMSTGSLHNLYFSVVGAVVTFSWEGGGPLTFTITGGSQNLTATICGLNVYNFANGAVDRYRMGSQPINPT